MLTQLGVFFMTSCEGLVSIFVALLAVAISFINLCGISVNERITNILKVEIIMLCFEA